MKKEVTEILQVKSLSELHEICGIMHDFYIKSLESKGRNVYCVQYDWGILTVDHFKPVMYRYQPTKRVEIHDLQFIEAYIRGVMSKETFNLKKIGSNDTNGYDSSYCSDYSSSIVEFVNEFIISCYIKRKVLSVSEAMKVNAIATVKYMAAN